MPLNLTGPISIGGSTIGQSINLELGRLATATSSLNETDLRTLAGILSGAISINDFYGKGGEPPLPSVEWTLPADSRRFLSVAWSGTRFVAVGVSSIVYTSTDGITWTSVDPGFLVTQLSSIVWSGTQFVVVGVLGTIRTSPDGITWTAQTSGTSSQLNSIVWSGSLLVAVGVSGDINTSPDGITWTYRPSNTIRQLNGVTWSGTQFVVVGESGDIRTSPDGITWTARVSGITFGLNGVTWSGTQFVVVGASGAIRTSPDGITWTARTSGTTSVLNAIVWSGTQFVVVGITSSSSVITSPDGITWTAASTGFIDESFFGVVWTGTQLVIVGTNRTIRTSPNAFTWTTRQTSPTPLVALRGAVWTGVQFVVVGAATTIRTSPDGITWTERSAATATFNAIVWSGSLLVAVGNGGAVRTSPDGITWTLRSTGTISVFNAIVWSGTQFVVVGASGAIRTSPDGITWTARTSGTTSVLNAIVWSGTQFVVVGASGVILTSPDGITWTAQTSGTVALLKGIAWSGTQFVTVASTTNTRTSPDGITWTEQTLGGSGAILNAITWTDTLFVTVGALGNVRISENGSVWAQRNVPINLDLLGVAWSGSQLLTVGSFGLIAKSGDVVQDLFTAVIDPSVSSVNEGGTVTFNVSTSGFASGTLYWTILGTATSADFSPAVSSGSFNISSSSGSVSLNIVNDVLTEGTENFQLQVRTSSTSGPVVGVSSIVTINDTSLSPTATVTPSTSSVNEGGTVTFNVSTSGFASGTLYWTILGTATSADFSPAVSSGSFNISSSSGSVVLTTLADELTEGNENFQLQVRTSSTSGPIIGTSSTVTINDTSLTPAGVGWSANLITQTSTAHTNTGAGPISIYFRRHVFVVTYSSAEIQAALGGKSSATISGLRFTVTNQPLNQPLPDYAIGMKLTTNSTTTNNSGSAGGTFTLVKAQASESFTTGTVKEFVTTPFSWNSGQNLVVSFAWGQNPITWNSSGTVPIGSGTSFFARTDASGTYLITDSVSTTAPYRPVIQLFG